MENKILIKRGYLVYNEKKGENDKNFGYYSAKLFNKFGVIVDKPQFLRRTNLKTVADFFEDSIPDSFYSNPQDTKNFTADELLIEQLVSYFVIEVVGENSPVKEIFERKEIFKKALPNYKEGSEVKVRYFTMISTTEKKKVLKDILLNFCTYTRPWSEEEIDEFMWLYENGYYDNENLSCKDNAIEMLLEYKSEVFAKMLDRKDIVKMSLDLYNDYDNFDIYEEDKLAFELAVKNAKECPMSLKQAKYFNTIAKKCHFDIEKQTNEKSPYKQAKKLVCAGKVLEAAQYLKTQGSLFERSLVWLLSRADENEAVEILNLLEAKNPIILLQFIQKVACDDYSEERTFVFTKNNKLKSHTETEFEFMYRKSKLSPKIKQLLLDKVNKLIDEYYMTLPSLGKIYLSDELKKVAIPLNTSACGMGLDVLPTGSRLPVSGKYLRTFCYWNDAFDIDTSVIFVSKDKDGVNGMFYWGNYSGQNEMFGGSALCSGDCRDKDGSEFIDFDIEELNKLNYKYAIFVINGYGSMLNKGSIYCGYQNKENLETKTWSPKNIELKINVVSDSREYIGFAVDIETKEVIILNQNINSNGRVAERNVDRYVKEYLKSNYLDCLNMYTILRSRGQIVSAPEEADVVFDRNYMGTENQELVRPFQIEKLVKYIKN